MLGIYLQREGENSARLQDETDQYHQHKGYLERETQVHAAKT